jgi:two-component system, OmpR family, alkaline phosphatase synthesis response regulator PhoP
MLESNQKILIVDDDNDILEFLYYNLQKENYSITKAHNGLEALEKAKEEKPDLILMDLMMPVMDGIESCQLMRKELKYNPIITFLSSRSEDYSQIAAFDAGANDYICKPIRPRLLLSKVKALLKSSSAKSIDQKIESDTETKHTTSNLEIYKEKYLVVARDEKIFLPKKEFELLYLLATNPGRVYTREYILNTIWGNETIVGERTIDVHIRKLREKLGIDYIRTVKGVGYTFQEE